MNFNFEAVTQTNLRYCGQLKSTFAAVAALALCTASMGAELVPPLTSSSVVGKWRCVQHLGERYGLSRK